MAAFFGLALVVAVGIVAPMARPEVTDYPPLARSDAETRILRTLDGIAKSGQTYANVPASDGRMLRLLAESINAQNVVEIGTSTGVSGLWLCLALQGTGGRLTTFELDAGRAAIARSHFQAAGVDRLVKVVEGDAHETLTQFREAVDLAFIDAEKQGYLDYLKQLLPMLRPGGLILAHNARMVPEYVSAVAHDPELETVFYMRGGGLVVTMKKR
jgi:predicted O-methyltransferase YrrM